MILSIVFCGFSQNTIDYSKVDSTGKLFTSKLKNGDIEFLKNTKPTEGTWLYSDLLEYKNDLINNLESIRYGSYIEPSKSSKNFGYNLFAYKVKANREIKYYFVAIVNIDISTENYKVGDSYLFTQKESLKSWWSHTFGFYHNSNTLERNKIPKEFLFPVCPPPPFNEE